MRDKKKPDADKPHWIREVSERILQGLAAVMLCIGAWFYCAQSSPMSGQLRAFVPLALAVGMYFLMTAWPSLAEDPSTLVGLVLVLVGSYFYYHGAQSASANPTQKSDLEELGVGLIGAGVGVFVGQRLPRTTKRNGVENEQN
jgi:4-amino-4-deoxy-L-arabinose transferase-like glycosyltransferase